jgi:hypothetical protein
LKASRITILQGSTIASDIYSNQLSNSGILGGTQYSPLSLPVVAALPPFEAASPGTKDVTVAQGKSATLAPGKYRNAVLNSQSTLTLTSAGTYEFITLRVESNAKLLFTGPAHIHTLLWFDVDKGAYVGPVQGSVLDASSITVYVGGADSLSQFLNAATIGPCASVYANIYTSQGTICFGDGTNATGAFIGRNIFVGQKVNLTLATGFSGLSKSGDGSRTQQPADPGTPKTFALVQNYPNPFNPSTLIRYQLPDEREVTLVVYNILGQTVKTLVHEFENAGTHEILWDATNDQGRRVSSGLYVYRIKAGTSTDTKKMILLK